MKKNLWIWLGITAFVMFWLPMFAIMFGKDEALAACLLLFLIVNPAYALGVGCYAGTNVKERWSLPIITAVMFLVGVWIMFTITETAFLVYAVCYLAIGYAAMALTMIVVRTLPKKTKKK